MINKRWYDSDPILKEALELLRLSPDETKDLLIPQIQQE